MKPLLIAQMICRNEVDVIEEIVTEVLRWADGLVVWDGASNDGTWEILHELAFPGGVTERQKPLWVRSEPDPDNKFQHHNLQRQNLLDYARIVVGKRFDLPAWHAPASHARQAGRPETAVWFWTVDADEILDEDPWPYIARAEMRGYNVIDVNIPQFWITLDDIHRGILLEDPAESVQKRRRWYSWGWWGKGFFWRDAPHLHYPRTGVNRDVHGWREGEKRILPERMVLKHYCFRSLTQAAIRMQERLTRGPRLFGKYAENWIIDEKWCGLHHLDEERVYIHENNHERIYKWFKHSRLHALSWQAREQQHESTDRDDVLQSLSSYKDYTGRPVG